MPRSAAIACLLALGLLAAAARGRDEGAEHTPGTAPAPVAAPLALAGLDLASALERLRQAGLAIVYTSELVRPEMLVASAPIGGEPVAVLQEVLRPHGLRAVPAGGVWVVVAAPRDVAPAAAASRSTETPPSPPPAVLRERITVRTVAVSPEPPGADRFDLDHQTLSSVPALDSDPLRAVTLLPGATADDLSARFSVQGGRPDQVSVELDGQELYDPYHLKEYHDGLGLVPELALGSANLHTGGLPASFGDRLTGVLDLRSGAVGSGHQVVQASSLDTAVSGAGTAGTAGWLLTARRGSPQLPASPVGDRDPRYWDLFARLDDDVATLGSFSGHALASDDTLDVRARDADDPNLAVLRSREQSRYGWVSHQRGFGERLLVDTVASWASVQRARDGDATGEEGGTALRDRRELTARAADQTWSMMAASDHLLSAGWQARSYRASFDYAFLAHPGFTVEGPLVVPVPAARRFDDTLRDRHLGLWASDMWTRGALTLTGGLRYDRDDAGAPAWSPRVQAALALGGGIVRGSWGRYEQTQRPYELQVEDGETQLAPPERSTQWDLQYERRRGSNSLGVRVYRQHVDDPRPRYENLLDPLAVFPEARPDRARIMPGASIAQGIELLLRGGDGHTLGWWAGYTWARAEDRLVTGWVPRPLDQRHSLLADLDWRPTGRWDLNLAWRFHTGWPTTGASIVEGASGPTLLLAGAAAERFPAYHRLDLRLGRHWETWAGSLELFGELQNVYGRRNIAGTDIELVPATSALELHAQHWPALVPVVGGVWRH